ncbi:unnamed protein product [Effrenium voratum]|nr:unnamed protein product [Effrenium voratum]
MRFAFRALGPCLDTLGCFACAFAAVGQKAALGWSLHGPALCSGLRLSLLLVLFLVGRASRGSDRTRTWNILRQVFPYAVYVPLTGLCVARVVTDPPPETPSGALFWLALVLSFLCGAAEDRLTLQAPRARAENETELLETPSAADAAGEGEAESRRKKDSLWKLLDLVLLEWPLLIQAGICLMVAAIADVLIPHYISQTISLIILAEEQGTLASRPYKQPVLCLLLAAATSAVFSAMRGGTFIVIGGRLGVTLRCRLLETLTRQEIGFFDTTKIGELTSRMTQDCQQVVDQAYLNVNVFLRTLVSIITTIAFMFSITVPLTMVAFVSVPCVVIVCMKYSEIFRQISEKAQESLADANAVANESLGNMSTVRSFAAEGLEVRRFATAMAVYRWGSVAYSSPEAVLLLDEATSALDAESEFQVQRAIDAMIAEGSMTVVIIAHRLSTVKNSHKICVIKGGQVVEEGSHEALLAARGAYFQLVECQLNGDAKAASQ